MIEISGIKINYVDYAPASMENDEEAILFLHGWAANLNCFNPSIELLKSKYRVLAIDLPGFGQSEEPSHSLCLDDYCDIIIEFLNKLNIKKVILIGHSYGGRIIIKLNNKKDLPFVIEKNVLIDAAGIKHELSFKNKLKVNVFKSLKFLSRLVPNEDLSNELESKLKKKFGSADYSSASPIMRDTMVRSINEDLKPLVKNIEVETLLIWGDLDTATPISDAKYMDENIRNSGLVVLKNCGHFSFLEDQGTYLRVLQSYFNI